MGILAPLYKLIQIDYPEVSKSTTDEKIEHICQIAASVLVTGCPESRLTIKADLGEMERIWALHPIQLIDRVSASEGEKSET